MNQMDRVEKMVQDLSDRMMRIEKVLIPEESEPDPNACQMPEQKIIAAVKAAKLKTVGVLATNLNQSQMVSIISELIVRGVFSLRNCVTIVAREIGVTRPTVYTYLKIAKEKNNGR